MIFSTWEELETSYCSNRKDNPYHEEFAVRRYNPSPQSDHAAFRLVFLKKVLKDPRNKTLHRKGRFIWCKNINYEGLSDDGFRQISFTVDKGQKKFIVAENNVLSVPAKVYVHNNRYFRSKEKTFYPFSTVFGYKNTRNMMARNANYDKDEFHDLILSDSPYKPGTLVAPRRGYFYPIRDPQQKHNNSSNDEHPCGIILGRSLVDDYMGREFYRVRFGATTYERVHPIQLEIVNEV
jgi:hypothetical protein